MILIISRNDFHYSFDTKGYMIYYQNNPIGGAGIDKQCTGCKANLKLFKESAEQDINNIMKGRGQTRYLNEINKIQSQNKGDKNGKT